MGVEGPMIITRSPLRIPLGGGGTDLPSYYREHGGFVLAGAIDRHVYIILHEPFDSRIILKYSMLEIANTPAEIAHPIIRAALELTEVTDRIEIASMSDIPAGAGMGSSGSFTVALLRALHALQNENISTRCLAEQACHIELNLLREPIGKQDQYAAAFGGLNAFTFHQDGRVDVEPLQISREILFNLEDSLSLFFTGFTRQASNILREQHVKSISGDKEMVSNLHFVKQLGYESKNALESGDMRRFGEIMHVHWEHKKARSGAMTNACIDRYYEIARNNGAWGGKLVGAGGGGFLVFCGEDKTRLRRALTEAGLRELRLRFEFEGTKVVVQS
jgi:D-glycero-alpha-D-manno-heptose-7-phosphate kinase